MDEKRLKTILTEAEIDAELERLMEEIQAEMDADEKPETTDAAKDVCEKGSEEVNKDVYPEDEHSEEADIEDKDIVVNEEDAKVVDSEMKNDDVYPSDEHCEEKDMNVEGVQEDPATRELKAEELELSEDVISNRVKAITRENENKVAAGNLALKKAKADSQVFTDGEEVKVNEDNLNEPAEATLDPTAFNKEIEDEKVEKEDSDKKSEPADEKEEPSKDEEKEAEKEEKAKQDIEESFANLFSFLRENADIKAEVSKSDIYPADEHAEGEDMDSEGVQEDPATRELKTDELEMTSDELTEEIIDIFGGLAESDRNLVLSFLEGSMLLENEESNFDISPYLNYEIMDEGFGNWVKSVGSRVSRYVGDRVKRGLGIRASATGKAIKVANKDAVTTANKKIDDAYKGYRADKKAEKEAIKKERKEAKDAIANAQTKEDRIKATAAYAEKLKSTGIFGKDNAKKRALAKRNTAIDKAKEERDSKLLKKDKDAEGGIALANESLVLDILENAGLNETIANVYLVASLLEKLNDVYPSDEHDQAIDMDVEGVQEDPATRELEAEDLELTEEQVRRYKTKDGIDREYIYYTDENGERRVLVKNSKTTGHPNSGQGKTKSGTRPSDPVDGSEQRDIKYLKNGRVELTRTDKIFDAPNSGKSGRNYGKLKGLKEELLEKFFRNLSEEEITKVIDTLNTNDDVYPSDEHDQAIDMNVEGVQEDPATRELKNDEVAVNNDEETVIEKILESIYTLSDNGISRLCEELSSEIENDDVYPSDEHCEEKDMDTEGVQEDPATRVLKPEELELTESFVAYNSLKEAFMLDKKYFTESTYVEVKPEVKDERLVEQMALLICKESNDPMYAELLKHASYVKSLTESCKKKFNVAAKKKAKQLTDSLMETEKDDAILWNNNTSNQRNGEFWRPWDDKKESKEDGSKKSDKSNK